MPSSGSQAPQTTYSRNIITPSRKATLILAISLEVAVLVLVHQVRAGARGERHHGERRVLAGGAREDGAVHHEQVLDLVRLLPAVQRPRSSGRCPCARVPTSWMARPGMARSRRGPSRPRRPSRAASPRPCRAMSWIIFLSLSRVGHADVQHRDAPGVDLRPCRARRSSRSGARHSPKPLKFMFHGRSSRTCCLKAAPNPGSAKAWPHFSMADPPWKP